MLLSVVFNLGMLGYFKYGGFLLENFQALAATVGIDYTPPAWNIVLPVGISFYTFVTMSYTLDVYLRRARPGNSFLDFALFVTFFPHLVAGPIMRPTDLLPQFERESRPTRQQLRWGLMLMTLGLFNKIVIADGLLAPVVDKVYGAKDPLATLDAWLGTLAFSGQIFCDFAGYTTTAIGASLVLGISLIDNFRYPYASIGFSDFWRRWHISLSTWLRDYLYVPLGGNRKGPGRTYVNLMLTMLLGGLWHGAAWTFVVWGGLHGLFLVSRAAAEAGLGRVRAVEIMAWAPDAGRADLCAREHHLGVLSRARLPQRLAHARLDARLRACRPADPDHLAGHQRDRAGRGDAGDPHLHARARPARRGGALAGRARWPGAGRHVVPDRGDAGGSSAFIYFQF